jgi:hypothetical protein
MCSGSQFGPAQFIGQFNDSQLHFVVGCAASSVHPGILYVNSGKHGDGPILAAIDATTAEVRGTFHIQNAGVHDWEDIAVGPCHIGAQGSNYCIFIGDVGADKGHPPANNIYRYLRCADLLFISTF